MRTRWLFTLILSLLLTIGSASQKDHPPFMIDEGRFLLNGGKYEFSGTILKESLNLEVFDGKNYVPVILNDGQFTTPASPIQDSSIQFRSDGRDYSYPVKTWPGWISLIPPIVALILAFWVKDVFIALFLSIFSGALLMNQLNPFKAILYIFNRSISNMCGNSLQHPNSYIYTQYGGTHSLNA